MPNALIAQALHPLSMPLNKKLIKQKIIGFCVSLQETG